MAEVYILYSQTTDKFYTGSSVDGLARAEQHLSVHIPGAYTSKTNDWVLSLLIRNLEYSQARKIESHIKRMKSKKYIENLKKYPEMVDKLNKRFL